MEYSYIVMFIYNALCMDLLTIAFHCKLYQSELIRSSHYYNYYIIIYTQSKYLYIINYYRICVTKINAL